MKLAQPRAGRVNHLGVKRRRTASYQRRVRGRHGRVIAFDATTVPTRQQASLQDWGVKIALWVSAIEILARRAGGQVSEQAVRTLLGRYEWRDPKLDH